MPIWHPDDAEILLKAAELPDGSKIAVALNIGLDMLDSLPLAGPWTQATAVQRLAADGSWQSIDGALSIQTQLPPLGFVLLNF